MPLFLFKTTAINFVFCQFNRANYLNGIRPHGVMASHQLDVLRVPGSIPGVANLIFCFTLPISISLQFFLQDNKGNNTIHSFDFCLCDKDSYIITINLENHTILFYLFADKL